MVGVDNKKPSFDGTIHLIRTIEQVLMAAMSAAGLEFHPLVETGSLQPMA
jgi:hypothetical protein